VTVREPEREIEVIADVDVLVAGAGVAGCAAAVVRNNEAAGIAVRIEWTVADAKSSGAPSAALRGEVRAAQTREELAVVPRHVIHGHQPSLAVGGELTESNKEHNVSANVRV